MNVKRNIIANFLGRGLAGVANLIAVPFYIKFLGMESYGLIGIYITLLGLLSVMDLGLSTTLNRIMAQQSAVGMHADKLRDLVKSFGAIYWCIGFMIGLAMFVVAPYLAEHWINCQNISQQVVVNALRIMGGVIALYWPSVLYSSGLMGAQQQVSLNVIRSIIVAMQVSGAIIILWKISPTIEAFFAWQLFVFAVQAWLMGRCLSKSIPAACGHKARIRIELLLHDWKFSAGTLGIALVSVVLMQLDKIIISKVFTLSIVGYYTTAFMVSNSLSNLANPIFSAVFPRFSQLFAEKNNERLAEIYHRSCQLISLLVVPVGINLSFFSREVILFWIRDSNVASNISHLLSVTILGTIANLLMLTPLALQLSAGYTKLSFYKGLIAVVLFVPLLFILLSKYGVMGGAMSWVILNLCYILFEPLFMHRRILKLEMAKWYWFDVGVPVVVSVITSVFFVNILPFSAGWKFSLSASLLTTWIILTLIFFGDLLRMYLWKRMV